MALDGHPPVEFADSVRKFLAFPIWNYAEEKVQIMELAQSSLQKELKAYEKDTDWGDLTTYDLEIERTGNDKMSTRYRVSPKPKAPLAKEIDKAIEALPNLDMLYSGEDPFSNDVKYGSVQKAVESVETEDLPF